MLCVFLFFIAMISFLMLKKLQSGSSETTQKAEQESNNRIQSNLTKQ